ncbi:MAG: hypothetical protein JNL08_00965 [Planctomycetes bacterium]|nr:hypothetical protein [Planctomycetota bacterium]
MSGLTGFLMRPVVVYVAAGIKPERQSPLWEMVVTGCAGHADPASGISLVRVCRTCGLEEYSSYKRGLRVSAGSYDGTDVFTLVEYPRLMLCTKRFVQIVEEARLSNIGFADATALQWPDGVIRPEE